MLSEKQKNEQLAELGEIPSPKTVILHDGETRYIQNFFDFYKLTMPEGLAKALVEFDRAPTLRNQNMIRMALCEYIKNDTVFFSDERFSEFRQRAAEIASKEAFDLEFLPLFQE